MKNSYQVIGSEVAITLRALDTKQSVICWVDLPDLELLLSVNVRWYANPARAPRGKYYVNGKLWDRETKKMRTILLHRALMGYPEYDVNHKDNDGLNNRRENLNTLQHIDNMRWRWPERDWSVRDERKVVAQEYRQERAIARQIEQEFGLTRQGIFNIRRGKVRGSRAAFAYFDAIKDAGIRDLFELQLAVKRMGEKWGVVVAAGKVIE